MDVIKQYFEESKESVRSLIPTEVFEFDQADNDGKLKNYQITPQQFETALTNKFSDAQKYLSYLAGHLEDQRSLIAAFASTPIAFSDAWNMKTEELTSDDVVALTKSGGHFQFNQLSGTGSMMYRTSYPKGLVQSLGTGITKGFRHRTGGIYEEDSLNEMGIFKYATPTGAAGMMEYRFVEQFSSKLGIPFIYLITQWFKYSTNYERDNQWLYMTSVAKVVNTQDHPYSPIELQLISKDEALKHVDSLLNAIKFKGEFTIRPPMPEHLRLGWSYSKIKGDKRAKLVSFAREKRLGCPGTDCGGTPFSKLKNSDIHIGHRISQHWNSQNVGVVDVHHPYNLYLSCAACNIALSAKYPTEIDKLIQENGTIGDWLMNGLLDA
jgi:hypothetical protein